MNPRPAIVLALLLGALTVGGGPAPAQTPTTGDNAPPAAPAPAHGKIKGRLTPPARPARALQVLNLDCRDAAELDARLLSWQEAGVRTVIFRVFHNRGDGYYRFVTPAAEEGVYFQTAHCPVVADALTPILDTAHRRGLRVIAWMTSRYADYGGGSSEGRGCMKWDPAVGLTSSRGWSALLPEVADRLALIYADLARYPIDGVLIQDDLILRHTEDMNPRVRGLYRAETGRSAEPEDLFVNQGRGRVGYRAGFTDWRRWQNRKLLALAERLRAAVQSSRPRAPVGLNLYYENLTAPENALTWYAQDLDAALASDLDFYGLMLYHRQVARELKISDAAALDLIERGLKTVVGRVDHPQRLWVKAQSVDWENGRPVPSAQVADLLGRARKLGPLGLVIMPAPRELDLNMVKESFK